MSEQSIDKKRPVDFFSKDMAETYDTRNSKLSPIADAMHFHIRLLLKDLPSDARVLCVGVGTGAEILSLSREYPKWSFVGIDPSAPMLDVCRKRLEEAGVMDRCELIHGYVEDLSSDENFDAVLSILVAHFIRREDRPDFYSNIRKKLKVGGYFVSTEICFDLESAEFPPMLKNWERVQELMGATPEALQSLPDMLRNSLCILTPSETQSLIRSSGISLPIRFFQAFMISGWYGQKAVPETALL